MPTLPIFKCEDGENGESLMVKIEVYALYQGITEFCNLGMKMAWLSNKSVLFLFVSIGIYELL